MSILLEFCAALLAKTFAAGETILGEGRSAGVLYILESCSVEIVKGSFQITTVSEPGAVFGEVSVVLGTPHMASVRALQDSCLRVADDPIAFLQSHPSVGLAIARMLARRLQFVTGYLADLKRQLEGSGDHLEMVDEVLETLVHQQDPPSEPGSKRHLDPTAE
jgi:CRP/FNR family transcriptional regulator, cyclic AMP receptor protein